MSELIGVTEVSGTESLSSAIKGMETGHELYWRVRACAANANDGVSVSRRFTPTKLHIISPYDTEQNVSLTPTIMWSVADRQVRVQVSSTGVFDDEDIVIDATATGSYTVPKYILKGYTSYTIRLKYSFGGYDVMSAPVTFTTCEAVQTVPEVVSSADGILYANSHLAIKPIEGVKKYAWSFRLMRASSRHATHTFARP